MLSNHVESRSLHRLPAGPDNKEAWVEEDIKN